MKYNLVVRPLAELDMEEVADWYEKQKEDLGLEFLNLIEELRKSLIKS